MGLLDFTPADEDLGLYRGKGGSFEIEFTDDDDQPMSLPTTGWKSQVRVKPQIDAELLMEFTIDASNAGAGSVIVSWTGSQTAPVIPKKGYWDIDCADADDVYMNGVVTFEGEVTAP